MPYCYRCERPFRTLSALNQHTSNSARHNVCSECYYTEDFETYGDLREHAVDEHYGCPECYDVCTFDSESDLQERLYDEHHMCSASGQCFNSASNLKYHQLVHRNKTIECFACYRTFVTKSAMVLHLEEGTCNSGTNLQAINGFARDCRKSDEYLDDDGDCKCPTCEKYFKFMSGLLQHVESDSCDETLRWRNGSLSIFLRFLKARVLRG
ncbi:hypothetical protein GGI43DRAFT_52357 [Trichoderma evansii]